ncbi:MAG: universal stress protein [Archaeoglobaceae archaeon]
MLFPTDFSPYSKIVLEFLKDLKEIGLEEVGVIFVVNTSKLSTINGGFDLEKYIEFEEKRADKEAPTLVEKIESEGVKAKILKPYPSGNPVVEIIKRSSSYDFISIGARGLSLFKEILLGSVSEGVIRKSKIPVYVFKVKYEAFGDETVYSKPCGRLFEKILVAYDFSKYSQKCLEYAKYIAEKTNGEIILLHVDEDESCKIDDLSSVVSDLEGVKSRAFKIFGSPAKTILRTQKELNASTIFIGSRGMGLAKSFILGSVSDPVIRMSSVPVFVCKEGEG